MRIRPLWLRSVQLVDRLERREMAHHEVAVAARADERVGAQIVVLSNPASRGELALVCRALLAGAPPPGGVHLDERVLDVAARLSHWVSVEDRMALCV